MTTELPRLQKVQNKNALTPTVLSPALTTVTIDLTKSPYTPEYRGTVDCNYDLFARQLDTSYCVNTRHLRPDCKLIKKTSSLQTAQKNLHPRSPKIQALSPKGSPKTSKTISFSPFTPENKVKLRPQRGHRLQDVLRVQPITPVNYYKNRTRSEEL